MFWRIVDGCFWVLFMVGWGSALFGGWELGNRELTFWVMLALAIGLGHKAFDKHPK